MTFAEYLSRLRSLYETVDRELKLRPPASEAKLVEAERDLGMVLDPGLRTAWATADGADEFSPFFGREDFLTPYDFISLRSARTERQSMHKRAQNYVNYDQEQRDSRIRDGWFQVGWVPFADFGSGSLLLLSDMSPSEAGQHGQVIGFVHDPEQLIYVAPSFGAFLDHSIQTMDQLADEYFM